MRLVKPSYEIIGMYGSTKSIEFIGRTCYKSEDKITDDSADRFVKMITQRGHHSVLEHSALSVKFIIDRGVSHELVRHRLCAFSQESTRYCNYKSGVTFVIPPWFSDIEEGDYPPFDHKVISSIRNRSQLRHWLEALWFAEDKYIKLLELGQSPQQARAVLPNSLKTEIVVTANFREWLHIFNLRCSKAAHPQIREVMIPLRDEMIKRIPAIFKEGSYN